eukprot:5204699-Pleurochrysis_carterae.AAC.1
MIRLPRGVGGDKMVLTLAKRHSVPEDSHRAETERSESLKLGAQRTSLRVIGKRRSDQSRSEQSGEDRQWRRNVRGARQFRQPGRHSHERSQ